MALINEHDDDDDHMCKYAPNRSQLFSAASERWVQFTIASQEWSLIKP